VYQTGEECKRDIFGVDYDKTKMQGSDTISYPILYLQLMSPDPYYNESEFLKRVSEGDVLAFRKLFDHYRNKVFYIARQLLHSDSAAEDAVQEVFLKIWLHNQKLASVVNFTAYLNTITRNHIYNVLRKQAGEERLLHTLIGQELQQGSPDTMNAVAFHELQELLREAMDTLSPQQRKVFEKSRLEGLKQDQIAKEMNLAKETVKKYLADALEKLRKHLGSYGKGLLLILLLVI
jgi:RNA polymerase sigma-70 factor (family 1)